MFSSADSERAVINQLRLGVFYMQQHLKSRREPEEKRVCILRDHSSKPVASEKGALVSDQRGSSPGFTE